MYETSNRIRAMLKGSASDDRIEVFIRCFVFFCHEEMHMNSIAHKSVRKSNRKILQNNIIKLKDQFRKVLDNTNSYAYGKSISENNPKWEALRNIFINPEAAYSEGDVLGVVHASNLICEEIWHTWDHLYNINVLLDKIDELEKQKEGRPNADTSEMVFHIARAYDECIKKPTKTKSGPFYMVIQEAYKITGKWKGNDFEEEPDVTKPVNAAIDRLRKESKKGDKTIS